MSEMHKNVIAIETAVAGGSLCVFKNGAKVASWTGSSDMSRAEDVLINIKRSLDESDVKKEEIDLIAVSSGPGSFTGIRIGLSTAMGLRTGLGCDMSSVSTLVAMAANSKFEGEVMAAVPMGRNAVCTQILSIDRANITEVNEPTVVEEATFIHSMDQDETTKYILHGSLAAKVENRENIFNAEYELAEAIGVYCLTRSAEMTAPIFVSKNF